jgi:hypothetical protein
MVAKISKGKKVASVYDELKYKKRKINMTDIKISYNACPSWYKHHISGYGYRCGIGFSYKKTV